MYQAYNMHIVVEVCILYVEINSDWNVRSRSCRTTPTTNKYIGLLVMVVVGSCCLLIIFPVPTRYTNRILTIFYCTFKIVRFPPKSATYSKNAKFIHLIKGQLTNIKCGTIVSINQLSVFIMPIIIHTSHTMHLFRLKWGNTRTFSPDEIRDGLCLT